MRRTLNRLFLPLVLAGGCGGEEPPPPAANGGLAVSLGPIPRVHARVRVVAPHLGPGWRIGMFNQTRAAEPCYLVLLFDPGNHGTVAGTVYMPAVTRLQVSSLYPSLAGQPIDPDPGAGAYDAEEWIEIPVASVQAASRNCPGTTDSTGGLPSKPLQTSGCLPKVTPRPATSRGLPQSFYDQGRASLPRLYPRHRLLAEFRDGRIGTVEYSLLAFQVTPADSVTLEAVAVERQAGKRAWDLEARCAFNDWSGGLVAMMEALAALPQGIQP